MSRASSATTQHRSSSAAPSGRSLQSNASPNFPSQPHNSRQVRWGSDHVIERSQEIQEPPQLDPMSDSEEQEEGMNGIGLAISVVRGKLGCAYYDSNDNKIYFLGDQPDSSEFDLANLGTLDFSSPSSQSRRLTLILVASARTTLTDERTLSRYSRFRFSRFPRIDSLDSSDRFFLNWIILCCFVFYCQRSSYSIRDSSSS